MHRRTAQEALGGLQSRLSMTRLAFPALVLANVFLAFGPWMVRLAGVGPVAAGFWRLTIAAPLLLVATIVTRQKVPPRRIAPWLILLCAGLFFAGDLAAWHAGIMHTRLANATLFGNITSFLFPIYGFILARRLPGRAQMVALALAFSGVVFLMGRSYELSARNLAGDALCLLAGLCYTGYLIFVDRVRGDASPLGRLTVMTIVGTLPLLITAIAFGEQILPQHWAPLLVLAIGSQVLGQGLIIFSLAHVEPLVVGLTLLVQPVIASTIGWVFYDERLGFFDFLGAAMIAIALIIVRRPVPPADA